MHAAWRIIDANLNRAREAFRVMEEYARLGLDDAILASELKSARHALAQAITDLETCRALDADNEPARETPRAGGAGANIPRRSLIAHRDIVGDVGRDVSAPGEYARSDECDVAVTAGKRLGEALRAIEEYGKTIDPRFAASIERLRYRGYELERRLAWTVEARRRFSGVRLYVLLTESLCNGDWFATAEAALAGGVDCLQLREKDLSDRELVKRGRRLSELCRQRGALLVINDRPDIAVLSKAHGVHVGQGDVTVSDARRIVSSAMLVGVSTHTPEQLVEAAEAVPDYIAVGPMFPTATKPATGIAGPQALVAARSRTSLPLVAVGGIDTESARTVLSAADCCLCVCRAVIAQPDVAAAAARLRAVLDPPRSADRPGARS